MDYEDDLRRLHERLDLLNKTTSEGLNAITVEIAEMREAFKHCTNELQEHDLTIQGPPGNGSHPGLVTRMAAMEKTVEGIETNQGKWKWLVVGGVANLLIGVTTGVFVGWMLMLCKG